MPYQSKSRVYALAIYLFPITVSTLMLEMPNNKVSPEASARTPLLGETPSTTSVSHFDDDGPPIEYSKVLQKNRPTHVTIGAKRRTETSFDFSSLLEPIHTCTNHSYELANRSILRLTCIHVSTHGKEGI